MRKYDIWHRLLAVLILMFLPVAILVACVTVAAREGMFDDFGGQLRSLVRIVTRGEVPR